MRLFFQLLYHPFAWAYDLVAWVVSNGRWRRWVLSAIPFLPTGPVLELGSGPGHLTRELSMLGMPVTAIDSSLQMIRLANRNIHRSALPTPTGLARANGQALPFASGSFASVVATFPAPYILEVQTLTEIQRVLRPGGKLVILLAARITGTSLADRFLRLLYRSTGETPTSEQSDHLIKPLVTSGFLTEQIWVEQSGSQLLFLIGSTKTDQAPN